MSRRLLVLCLLLGLSTALLAKDEGRQGYVIIKSNGQKIEGKISEKGGRVYIQLGATTSTDYAKEEVTVTYAEATPESSGNGAKAWVQIKKKDGSTVTGEVIERTDDSIKIRPKGQGPQTFKKADVEVTESEEPAAGDVDLGDRFLDYEGRFQIEKPGPEWKIRKSSSPETRALMTLTGQDAFVAVSVKSVPVVNAAYANPSKANARNVQGDVEADMKNELSKPGSIQPDAAELHGAPVFEFRYEGSFPNETTVYQFIEQRFAMDGLVYSIKAAAEKKNTFKTVEPKLREAFASFSFIATQGGDDDGYNDLIKGFGIVRPTAKWTVDARPFDDKEPVVITENNKRGTIRVLVQDAGGRDAATFVDTYLKDPANRSDFKVVDKAPAKRNGYSVMTYHCAYFEGKNPNKSDEQGLVAVADSKVIHVIGIAPYADADAKDVQGEVQRVLDAFKVFDPKRGRLGDVTKAITAYSSGVDLFSKKQYQDAAKAFGDAIGFYPDYARAYYAKAEAEVQLKDWIKYREDLQHVIDLDPRPETAQRAANLYRVEADTQTKDKQWDKACRAWKEVVRCDPKDTKNRGDLLKFYDTWWGELKKVPSGKKPDEVVQHWEDSIKEIEGHQWTDKDFEPKMATIYVEAGTAILQADKKSYSKASGLANRALSLDRSCKAATELKKQCDDARKQLEKTPPKGK